MPRFRRYDVLPASTLDAPVYRAVPSAENPTADAFRSYADLGRELPGADPVRLTAVSMHLTIEHARRAQARYGLPPEMVAVDLRREADITYSLTNESTGHISVWAPSSEVLLACVIGPA